jgi:hypothetical protein
MRRAITFFDPQQTSLNRRRHTQHTHTHTHTHTHECAHTRVRDYAHSTVIFAMVGKPRQRKSPARTAGVVLQSQTGVLKGGRQQRLPLALVPVVALAVVLAVVFIFTRPRIPRLEQRSLSPDVPRQAWSPSRPFAAEVAAKGEPIVLTGSVASTWPALRRWNAEYICHRVSTLQGVYTNTHRTFGPYFEHGRPLAPFVDRENEHSTNVSMACPEFFARLSNTPLRLAS